MHNSDFYIVAASVMPLLLISLVATRSFEPGEMNHHVIVAALTFGLPTIGELATFCYLFVSPVSTPIAVILAVATWAGLVSELTLIAWWGAELLRRDVPSQQGLVKNGYKIKPLWLCQAPGCNYRVKEGKSPSLCPYHRGPMKNARRGTAIDSRFARTERRIL